jgi:hypothetical protein
MITFIIGLIIGFVAGALVFRNNAKKAEAIIQKAQQEAEELKDKAKNLRK